MCKCISLDAYNSGHLDVGDGHSIYYEESGNPEGKPVVLCHGGPGSPSKPRHKNSFDPKHFRIILFDQRGCGKSTATDKFLANTTAHLVEDMERLRKHLGVTTWQVVGGSWGSTLALCYTIAYPESVDKLVVWGILLGDKWMIDWQSSSGLGLFFPDVCAKLYEGSVVPNVAERAKLLDGTLDDQINAALFNTFVRAGMTFPTDDEICGFENKPEEVDWASEIAYAKMLSHYEKNRFFLEEDFILSNMKKISNVTGHIIHGRYDMCCPVKAAFELHKAWPNATLTIVEAAAHRTQPNLEKAIIKAIHN